MRLKPILKRSMYVIIILGILIFLVTASVSIFTKPSLERDWAEDQAVLPYAEITNTLVYIHNIRNFTYASTTSYTKDYYDKVFELKDLKKVWYIVEPFSDFKGAAHTFVSFEFANDQFVSISVEIRKEKGEAFSALKGLFNQYEVMYVIGDERDLVKLRTNYRHDEVYVYPVKATAEKAQALFLDMIKRTNDLKENPEFYNSIFNNCTTNIASHVRTISPKRIPFLSLSLILPARSDAFAYTHGLIDTTLPFVEARQAFRINNRALKFKDDLNFSRRIRE